MRKQRYYKAWITEGSSFITESAKAICFEIDNGHYSSEYASSTVWFPKSQIKYGEIEEGTNNRVIYIPVWLFTTKGIKNPDILRGITFDRFTVEM